MADKKKAKPFKTAAGAQQFMRNFDLNDIVDSTYSEINKMKEIFEKESKKLGRDKFKEKYAGKTPIQVETILDSMRDAQLSKGHKEKYKNRDTFKMYDEFEKGNLELEKTLGKMEEKYQKEKRKTKKAKGGVVRAMNLGGAVMPGRGPKFKGVR